MVILLLFLIVYPTSSWKTAQGVSPLFLTLVYKTSVQQCVLPAEWENANVTPVYKSGDKTKTFHYRPVSLTSVCCKTLEHIIYTYLINHLQNNSFFYPLQHGLRAGFSCDTQLVEITYHIAAQPFRLSAYFWISRRHLIPCHMCCCCTSFVVLAYPMPFSCESKRTFLKNSSAWFLMVCAQVSVYFQEAARVCLGAPAFWQYLQPCSIVRWWLLQSR